MKRIIVCLLALAMGLGLFACLPSGGKDDKLKVYIPDGAPSLAIAGLMADNTEIGGREFEFIVVSPSQITSFLTTETADFAIVPTNAAANVYNKGKDYKLVASVTHGNLYIVGKAELSGETIGEKLAELRGKKLGVIGQSAVPDLTFRYIMEQYEIDHNIYNDASSINDEEISISYCADGAEAIRGLKLGSIDFALLGEPAVAGALSNIEGSSIALDLCDIWEDITGERLYPQASLVAKGNMDTELTNALIERLKEKEDWAKENPAAAVETISSHVIDGGATTISALSKETIVRCNIKIISSKDGKDSINQYLTALMSISAESVGGKLPDEDFFF